MTSNTLATAGDVWTISQIGTVQLVGTAPIIVTQYLPAGEKKKQSLVKMAETIFLMLARECNEYFFHFEVI